MLICIIPALMQAQGYSHEFGKVSKEELELKRYEKDTTAEAVVIYDIGKSYFLTNIKGFDLYYERKKIHFDSEWRIFVIF